MEKGIQNSWSLIQFATLKGRMQRGQFTNKETGEQFASCIFTASDGSKTFVSFSSKLGELSVAEIQARKNELQVVELTSGNYSLCAVGSNSWEDVAL